MNATEIARAGAADHDKWHVEFLLRVPGVILRDAGWPALKKDDDSGSLEDFWQVWRYGMARNRVRPAEAQQALMELALDPPDWISRIIPAFLGKIRATRAARGETADARMAAAARASEGCPLCRGDGLAILYPQEPADPLPEEGRWFYCVCESGRAILSHHRDCHGDDLILHADLADPRHANLAEKRYSRRLDRSFPASGPAGSIPHPHPRRPDPTPGDSHEHAR